jgi:hypothetical protein
MRLGVAWSTEYLVLIFLTGIIHSQYLIKTKPERFQTLYLTRQPIIDTPSSLMGSLSRELGLAQFPLTYMTVATETPIFLL